jgi:branched-chain amino acid transport system substrate-binding protein
MQKRSLHFTWLTFCLLLFGCQEHKPLKIGFLGSLTGRMADVSHPARNGCLLAIEDINARGGIRGRKVELVIYDDKHDPDKGGEGVRYLHNEGAVAIVGAETSQMAVSATPTANELKIPLISPTSATTELTDLKDYFFRFYPSCDKNAHFLAEYAVKERGLKRVAVLFDNSNKSFTGPWTDHFLQRLKELSANAVLTLDYETLSQKESFLELAKQIIAAKPDGLLILASALDTALICQQLRKLEAGMTVMASDWSYAGSLAEYGGKSVEGLIFTTGVNLQSTAPAYLNFQKTYVMRFGETAKFPAILAYEATTYLLKALEQVEDPELLSEQLVKMGPSPGLQDGCQLNEFGDVIRSTYINEIRNGAFHNLTKYN